MILITTSRKPAKNTMLFAKTLSCLLPTTLYTPRGKKNTEELADYAVSKGLKKIAVIHDRKGNPGKIEIITLTRNNWEWEKTIEILGVSSQKIKKQFTEIKTNDKKINELFLIESDKDAELEMQTDKNEIKFILNNEELMKIKIKIKQ